MTNIAGCPDADLPAPPAFLSRRVLLGDVVQRPATRTSTGAWSLALQLQMLYETVGRRCVAVEVVWWGEVFVHHLRPYDVGAARNAAHERGDSRVCFGKR